ncbi:MAG: MG2 domain-containing protein [Saprospiraceae bacterium]
MRKQMLLPAALFLAALHFSCNKVVKNEAYFQAIARYLYAYTSGDIGRTDAIRVRFVDPAVGQNKIGQPVDAGLFQVSPAIAGKAVWEDDRTIKLQPEEALPYGAKYSGTVQLGKIFGNVPEVAQVFDFSFRVRELSFELVIDGLRAVSENNLGKQQLIGRILTSDAVETAALEKTLTAKQGNKTLNIRWTHSADGLSHEFTVLDIERSTVRSNVELSWSGKSLGIEKSGKTEHIVPALDEFVVLQTRVVQSEEQYVLLNFSDPLDNSQILDGLIHIENYDYTLRFVIDGNFVRVYPGQRISGAHNLRVEAGIRNIAGAAMKGRSDWPLNFEDLKPSVRLVGRGAVIPQQADGAIIFPFEAVGLRAVDVEVFKIFNSNILQFLQVNELEGDQELDRVGKIIMQKKVALTDLNPDANSQVWQRYALDLQEIIHQDPGAIYQVRLTFRRGYAIYNCNTTAQNNTSGDAAPATESWQEADNLAHLGSTDDNGNLVSIWGGYRGIYYGNDADYWWSEDDDYEWGNRDNPCAKEYYNYEHFTRRNVFVSDLGITAKRGKDRSLFVSVNSLHTTQPEGGVDLELFNYQLQSIAKMRTDGNGIATTDELRETPFLIVATRGDRRGYLRMADGSSLSLSRFDVAGVEPQKGLKGYLYGERGVWRPGDSLYLNFVLEDQKGNLPASHPVTLELTDPRGAMQYRTTSAQAVGGVYPFHCATRADAPTGNWTAKVQVGGATFSKQLKIETVKPNRLKMNLDFGKKSLSAGDASSTGKLQVNWLHGATAKGLKAVVEMQLRLAQTEFKNFRDFVFDDPARNLWSEPEVLFDARLDDNGQANIPLRFGNQENAPGKLIANFKIRAFENSGDFSTDNIAFDYYPFERFVGVSIPKNSWGSKTIDRKGGQLQFACVDQNGKPMPGQRIEVGLYRCDWRWWWEEDRNSNVAQFNSANHVNAVEKTTLTTDGRGLATWTVRPNNWGRFLVRVSDPDGGHAAGDFFWSGQPDELNDIQSRNAAAMLPFSVGKEKYAVGDEVTLKVPASEDGRILLTLETGTRVLLHQWYEAKTGDNTLKFHATENMAPSVYAHVSLFQPHAQTKNDLPIRMYGVMPVNVENPGSQLKPQLDMPDVLKPGEPFTVSLRESSGKACTYTLAIVDEGLLDLTRFKTPNPGDVFFAREALGVTTWDMYDYVLGAYGAKLERILSIGGDAINQKAKNAAQINRFKPAVVHVGPFTLEKGKTAKHTLKLDNYVGSVRVMAVCSAPAPGNQGAYGSAEKTCPVRKPLMILPTLPRVLGPGETLRLPVEVFAMEKKVKNATIRVRESSGLVGIQGSPVNSLQFAQPGNELTYFDLKVGNRTGVAKFSIEAQGGGEKAVQTIEILVRNPNPVQSTVWEGEIEPGQEWGSDFDPGRYSDISSAVIEVSALPPVNLSRHLQYLIRYPHGCIEQTTSAAFPQLFVDLLTPLSQKEKDRIAKNVAAAITKLQSFQQSDGGFSYWPGGGVNDWSSTYAGHFLLEAKAKGYAVPQGMLDRWMDYQTKTSKQWSGGNGNSDWRGYDSDLNQAYRLYALAIAGKPNLAGMNRMKEQKGLYTQSALLLAAAYAEAGKAEAAREIARSKWRDDWRYDWCGNTYGSDLRDRALILETYTAIGDSKRASALVEYISKEMGNQDGWYWNTQSLATALRALSKYAVKNFGSNGPAFAYRIGGGGYKNGDKSKPISTVQFADQALNNNRISVKNNSSAKLYARLIISGQALVGEETGVSNNITLAVRYTDNSGNPVDISKLAQGTDFVAEVTIRRTGDLKFPFQELALSQVFPSGWEILNARMSGISLGGSSAADYQDIRDDRVYTYFDLPYSYDYQNKRVRETSSTYRIQLNAAYAGRYYLPAVGCEAMYDSRIRGSVPGRWVEVI